MFVREVLNVAADVAPDIRASLYVFHAARQISAVTAWTSEMNVLTTVNVKAVVVEFGFRIP
ncbi:hypothetical protein GDO78_015877 [Eleutherodactylus coqui]|uniref:Uncharacterized protein n=1 Tax=Eleutherodactylus coqui TaxID=57060 RepID=A0A8J6E3V2_ELECQ|nr:hypothetical protein GDO78_015877 [Eleutherodactylus coqui]